MIVAFQLVWPPASQATTVPVRRIGRVNEYSSELETELVVRIALEASVKDGFAFPICRDRISDHGATFKEQNDDELPFLSHHAGLQLFLQHGCSSFYSSAHRPLFLLERIRTRRYMRRVLWIVRCGWDVGIGGRWDSASITYSLRRLYALPNPFFSLLCAFSFSTEIEELRECFFETEEALCEKVGEPYAVVREW